VSRILAFYVGVLGVSLWRSNPREQHVYAMYVMALELVER
jgi:hypothetical protein